MILVLGATGKVGRELVPALLDTGATVRALTRDAARARIDPRAEVVEGDLDRPSELPRLLDGVERVFLLTPGHGPGREITVAEAAAAAGVTRLVKLSTSCVHFGQQDAITRGHAEAEQSVREAGPEWTILRPGAFMDNRFGWLPSIREHDTVLVTEGDPDSALIHVRDIAAVAALALTGPGHDGQVYPLSGGVSLSAEQQVETLSAALGRPLKIVFETVEETRARMLSYGWPAATIDGFFELKRESNAHEHVVFDTVERLLGRAPLTFADWAHENVATFLGA
ncbi:NAD(P)H-binding protein [Amycolatopsis sp. NPDC059021]|uniref:NAD(P)H-binding protein n=1 Tax=Amycolatopsis sp. NPDC059021 TaxID=3346704 RepID=UPI00366DB01D